MTHTPPLTIRRTEEPLPPLYAIRCVRWADGTPGEDAYLGGWLTAEARDAAILARGWVEDA